MPGPLDALRKASSIGPSTSGVGYPDQPYGSQPGEMKGEMPLGSGIFGGTSGRAVPPAIEALKDLFRGAHGRVPLARDATASMGTFNRMRESPIAKAVVSSMDREGPEQYLTALGKGLQPPAGEGLTNKVIESLFPIFFGR